MAPLLQSATTPTDGNVVVTVRGDIDTATAPQLWQYLGYLIGQGHHHLRIALHDVLANDDHAVAIYNSHAEHEGASLG